MKFVSRKIKLASSRDGRSAKKKYLFIVELKMVFERQNNLRPIFSALFRMNRRERQHASPLRRLLAEAGIVYSELQVSVSAWLIAC